MRKFEKKKKKRYIKSHFSFNSELLPWAFQKQWLSPPPSLLTQTPCLPQRQGKRFFIFQIRPEEIVVHVERPKNLPRNHNKEFGNDYD